MSKIEQSDLSKLPSIVRQIAESCKMLTKNEDICTEETEDGYNIKFYTPTAKQGDYFTFDISLNTLSESRKLYAFLMSMTIITYTKDITKFSELVNNLNRESRYKFTMEDDHGRHNAVRLEAGLNSIRKFDSLNAEIPYDILTEISLFLDVSKMIESKIAGLDGWEYKNN